MQDVRVMLSVDTFNCIGVIDSGKLIAQGSWKLDQMITGNVSRRSQRREEGKGRLTGEHTGSKIYDAGHILGKQLGGSATDSKDMYQNIVPMHKDQNRKVFNPFEGRARKSAEECYSKNCEVKYKVEIFYFEDLTHAEKAFVKNNKANLCGSRSCVPCKFKASYTRIVKDRASGIRAESEDLTFYNFPSETDNDKNPSNQSDVNKAYHTNELRNPQRERCH
ncbi:hypothetical protein Fcan01_16212 [Folsomia candida]|uniref:Type VII secretion system protein EssD-like domain-containing protein n=1 Tax=Folsomia candida TaxID=158441 RepID=A0A226DVG5_FOLCA|nr:hypothetical protein Fcan01_16212 [Folsomia candida]